MVVEWTTPVSDVRRQNSSWSEREQRKGKKARKGQQPPLPKKVRERGRRKRGGGKYLFGCSTTSYMGDASILFRHKIDL